jgi:AcrR family transcriptional regulator
MAVQQQQSKSETPRSALRRARILDAAQRVFTLSGFRGATMEAIALEASVAKATAYSYFPDKEAVFRAVAERIVSEITEAMDVAIARARSPLEAIIGAIVAKEQMAFRIIHGSPHARDLLESAQQLTSETVAAMENQKLNTLTKELQKLRIERPKEAARLLYAAAHGIASQATSAENLATDLDRVLRALLKGWAKRPKSPARQPPS